MRRRHDVMEASDGETAFALLERGERFDAILCDLMMPGRDGAEVLERIRTRHPEMSRRVAVYTAGAVTGPAALLVSSGEVLVLPEPCHSSVLYEAIDTLAR